MIDPQLNARSLIGKTMPTEFDGRALICAQYKHLVKSASGLYWLVDAENNLLRTPDENDRLHFLLRLRDFLPLLVGINNWVCYKLVPSKKKPGKMDKPPFSPITGFKAKANDKRTWGTFRQAAACFLRNQTMHGLGFELGESQDAKSGIVGIDLDNCVNPAGKVASWAMEIVDRVNAYTEISPSGTGLRIFAVGELPSGGRKKGDKEMYDYGRFLTVTGRVVRK